MTTVKMFLLGYWVITRKKIFSGGGIGFWWGGNKNLVGRGESSEGGNFSRWGG